MKPEATILAVLAVLGRSAVAIKTSEPPAWTRFSNPDRLIDLVSLEANAL